MGMELFSGEGLHPNFPLGGGVIFQPRGQGDHGPNLWDSSCVNVDIYNNRDRLKNAARQPQIFS